MAAALTFHSPLSPVQGSLCVGDGKISLGDVPVVEGSQAPPDPWAFFPLPLCTRNSTGSAGRRPTAYVEAGEKINSL